MNLPSPSHGTGNKFMLIGLCRVLWSPLHTKPAWEDLDQWEYDYTECNNVHFSRDGQVHLKWFWSECQEEKLLFVTDVSRRKAIHIVEER